MRNPAIRATIFIVAMIIAVAAAPSSAQVPAAPAGGVDPSKLPDIEGIHLGISLPDALAKMQALFGANRLYINASKFQNTPDKPWVSNVVANDLRFPPCNGPTCKDYVTVWFNTPPNKQVVVAGKRNVAFDLEKRPTVDNMIASLRQKYGQETVKNDTGGGQPWLIWLFDEQGRPLSASTPKFQPGCSGAIADPPAGGSGPKSPLEIPFVLPTVPLTAKGIDNLMINPCRRNVYVSAQLAISNTLLSGMEIKMSENAEDTRDVIAGQQYLDSVAAAQKQQQLNNAKKQAAPSL